MLLTSSFWEPPNSILWSITESSLEQKYLFLLIFILIFKTVFVLFLLRLSFTHDNHVEFGKAFQDKVLGTAEFAAHVSYIIAVVIKHKFSF